jgi:hypothetical protein
MNFRSLTLLQLYRPGQSNYTRDLFGNVIPVKGVQPAMPFSTGLPMFPTPHIMNTSLANTMKLPNIAPVL